MMMQNEGALEEDDQLHPDVRQRVAAAQERGLTFFNLALVSSNSLFGYNRLLLDRFNAEYVVAFLEQTPRISSLFMSCNINQGDGAMETLEDFFRRRNQHITTIHCDGVPTGMPTSTQGRDDLSSLECLSNALHNESTITTVNFYHQNFNRPQGSESFSRLLQNKTNFHGFGFFNSTTSDNAILRQVASTQNNLLTLTLGDGSWFYRNISDTFNILGQLKTLRSLCLYPNSMSAQAGKEFAQALKQLLTTDGSKIQDLSSTGPYPNEAEVYFRDLFSTNTLLSRMVWAAFSAHGVNINCEAPYLARNANLGHVKQMEESNAPLGLWARALGALLRHNTDRRSGLSPSFLALSLFLPGVAAEAVPLSDKGCTSSESKHGDGDAPRRN